LLSRFDHSVFMGIQCRGGANNDIYSVRRWGGNSFTVCGLCDSLKREILNDYEEREESIGKDEI